jgi:hypothetical protein
MAARGGRGGSRKLATNSANGKPGNPTINNVARQPDKLQAKSPGTI